jgi:hypothetical protein
MAQENLVLNLDNIRCLPTPLPPMTVFKRFGFNPVDDLAASEDRKIGESEKRLVSTHRPGNKPYGALYLSARAFDSVGRRTEAIEKLNHCVEKYLHIPPHKC